MDNNKKCTACNIKKDKNNYLKDRTFVEAVRIKTEEKTMITLYSKTRFVLHINN